MVYPIAYIHRYQHYQFSYTKWRVGSGSLNTVRQLFNERVPVEHQAVKCDDLWSIQNIWDITKERLSEAQYNTLDELKANIVTIWQNISRQTRHRLIGSIPKRCRKIIQFNGRRLTRDDYRHES